jgi:SAM-dependent methyltransferase
MRKDSLDLLLCPLCLKGGLRVEGSAAELHFGPLTCRACGATFAIVDGVADFLLQAAPPRRLQRLWESDLVSRYYEGVWRPLLARSLGAPAPDLDSEYLLYRSLLAARPLQPLLDLNSGPALFARRLAQEKAHGPTFALDPSRAMLEEGAAQAREHHLPIDLVRALVPPLPFRPGVLGGILHVNGLGQVPDLDAFFYEVNRVLAPRARYVATAVLSGRLVPRLPGPWGRSFTERERRDRTEAVGLKRFERIQIEGALVFKVEKG